TAGRGRDRHPARASLRDRLVHQSRARVRLDDSGHRGRVLRGHRRAAITAPTLHGWVRDRGRDLDARLRRARAAAARANTRSGGSTLLPLSLRRGADARRLQRASARRDRPRGSSLRARRRDASHGAARARGCVAEGAASMTYAAAVKTPPATRSDFSTIFGVPADVGAVVRDFRSCELSTFARDGTSVTWPAARSCCDPLARDRARAPPLRLGGDHRAWPRRLPRERPLRAGRRRTLRHVRGVVPGHARYRVLTGMAPLSLSRREVLVAAQLRCARPPRAH